MLGGLYSLFGYSETATTANGQENNESTHDEQTKLCEPPKEEPSTTPVSSDFLVVDSGASGNHLADVADMDDSWYIIPPPCFTGSESKLEKARVKAYKEAAIENALIEHPSIYIAESRQQQQQRLKVESEPVQFSEPAPVAEKTIDVKPEVAKVEKKKKETPIYPRKEKWIKKSERSTRQQQQWPAKMANAKKNVKAWDNKFIVSDWNHDDDQNDINDDFDNLFEPVEAPSRQKRLKGKSNKNPGKKSSKIDDASPSSSSLSYPNPFSVDDESDVPDLSTPAVIGVTSDYEQLNTASAESSIGLVEVVASSSTSFDSSIAKEEIGNRKLFKPKAPPTLVKPIEPERQPGWQLRKKRSKRRPLSASMANVCNATTFVANNKSQNLANVPDLAAKQITEQRQTSGYISYTSSNDSSARSSPSLIDRIGSRIAANLTTFTNGFQAQNNSAMPISQNQQHNQQDGKFNQTALVRKSNFDAMTNGGRKMSRSFLKRSNDCCKLGNSLRREDRRLKMHKTPNGISVNRKVQTNFH